MPKRWIFTLLGFVAIVVLAGLYRFYDIGNYPPGLFPDQAANGEDALLILNGDIRPFYERGNGREALFFYVQAAAIKTFGIGVWPMFASSALVGLLAVVAIYFATRPVFGRLAGLLAALFMATSYWQVTISRTGFRAGMIPLCVAAFTAFAAYTVRAVSHKEKEWSYISAALAGIMFSLGFYTYIAYRMMPAVVLALLFILVIAAWHPKIGFPHVRRYGWHVVIALLAALITLVPMFVYFSQHPSAFIGRAGQVSIFSPDLQKQYGGGTLLGTLTYSVRTTLLSFFVGHGDLNWRHSVAGYPLLNPLVAFLFLLGFAFALSGCVNLVRRILQGKEIHLTLMDAYLVLLWLAMVVPVVTTAEGMPHALRSEGVVVPTFMMAGVAAAVIIHWVLRRMQGAVRRGVALGVIVGLIVVGGLYDGVLYFFIARNNAQAYEEYRGDLTQVAQFLNEYRQEHPDSTRPYLVLDAFSVQTVHFLTSVSAHDYQSHPDEEMHNYTLLDPATSSLTPLRPEEVIVFTQSTLPDADRYASKYTGQIELIRSQKNRFGEEIMRIYQGLPGSGPGLDDGSLDA